MAEAASNPSKWIAYGVEFLNRDGRVVNRTTYWAESPEQIAEIALKRCYGHAWTFRAYDPPAGGRLVAQGRPPEELERLSFGPAIAIVVCAWITAALVWGAWGVLLGWLPAALLVRCINWLRNAGR